VARELNLLLYEGNPDSAQSEQVRRQYRALLDLTQVSVSLDVLSGTSAGGVNSAVLALANVNHADIGAYASCGWSTDHSGPCCAIP
jgi:hypothetical protein